MAMKPRLKLCVLAAVGAAVVAVTTAVAAPSEAASGPAPVSSGSRYLALGDSIPFGFRESNAVQTPNYAHASTFVGYPALVARDLHLRLTNASCPGETAASFIDAGQVDNGCLAQHDGTPGGYRSVHPLHTTYASRTQSQLQYARAFLKKYPGTKLVTLQIGANDGLRCIANGKCNSLAGQLAVLAGKVIKRLTVILNRIIVKGGYKGQFVLVNYYSVNSASPAANQQSQLLNNAEASVASKFSSVTIANAYGTYRSASRNAAHNDTCTAGLETFLTSAGSNENCGIHPSLAGHALIASSVERVVRKS